MKGVHNEGILIQQVTVVLMISECSVYTTNICQ